MNTTLVLEACARAAHEVNRAYCIALGDTTQPPWETAPDWQKDSSLNGVLAALNGATPEQSHQGWCDEKIATGWKWGPVKDPDKKEHPCLVSYAELPEAQRAKDALYLSTVRSVAAALGYSSGAPALRTGAKSIPEEVGLPVVDFLTADGHYARDFDTSVIVPRTILRRTVADLAYFSGWLEGFLGTGETRAAIAKADAMMNVRVGKTVARLQVVRKRIEQLETVGGIATDEDLDD